MPPKRTNTSTSRRAGLKKRKVVAKQANSDKAGEVQHQTQSSSSDTVVGSQAGNNARSDTASSPRFAGKFDLYSTQLEFLKKVYLPEGETKPQFEAIYQEVLKYQAKDDWSIRIALNEGSPNTKAGEYGMFSCQDVTNPLSDEEISPIRIINGEAKTVDFGTSETAHASMMGRSPGYIAQLELDAKNSEKCDCGMIKSGNGTLKMHKVWEGQGEDGEQVELFEGYFFFRTENGPTLRRNGWGSSLPYSSPFWGVRARKNEKGEEIGIGIGRSTYKSTHSTVEDYEDGEDEDGGEDEDDG
ncbi:hypothetical protein NM688_g5265 [Phlebia brevispora]|uniref:Uncharacterized protein n=1 Tax=Phlebia brevispora TaxID=194682 RepID=A0ACC1SY98_9APHY|nr:hypothetical protein NM688_g5265 [Phlebia brevispora]